MDTSKIVITILAILGGWYAYDKWFKKKTITTTAGAVKNADPIAAQLEAEGF